MTVWRSAVTSFVVFGVMSAATPARDLSKYRNVQLGADLPTVAIQTGMSSSQAKTIHLRPALIQELTWRPQPLGLSRTTESVQEVVFSFYNGELFQIVVNYDRYETEGLTTDDLVQAISVSYGIPALPVARAKTLSPTYEDPEEVLAQWQDPEHRFELIRASYGPTFRLIGVLKRLEAPAQAATLEAKRLDNEEAPQRDAARVANEEEAVRTRLDKARLVNKPKFQP
jgi:hypothetical protein